MNPVIVKTYSELPVCHREVLRYADCKEPDEQTRQLMLSCIEEADAALSLRVCYIRLPLRVCGSVCDFDCFQICSAALAKNLSGCREAIVFSATVGAAMDRLIDKYGRLSPAHSLMMSSLGSERIETLCDTFCADVCREEDIHLRARFSPGYGDLPLSAQKDIFSVLDCPKRLGLCLTDSLLMSPSKSVTAIAGVSDQPTAQNNKCSLCSKKDCTFRSRI